jgi:hypothetical protein
LAGAGSRWFCIGMGSLRMDHRLFVSDRVRIARDPPGALQLRAENHSKRFAAGRSYLRREELADGKKIIANADEPSQTPLEAPPR